MVIGQNIEITAVHPVEATIPSIPLFTREEDVEIERAVHAIRGDERNLAEFPQRWSEYQVHNGGRKKKTKRVLLVTEVPPMLGPVDISTCNEMLESAEEFATYLRKVLRQIRKTVDKDVIERNIHVLDYLIEMAPQELQIFITLDPLLTTLRRMMKRGDYASAMKALDFCTRRYTLWSNHCRLDILSLLLLHSDLDVKERSRCFSSFFEAFFETYTGRDSKYLDQLMVKLCELYEKMNGDAEIMKNFTTPPVIEVLIKLLESRLVGGKLWHFSKVCRVLTIICLNIAQAPLLFMGSGIGGYLLKLYKDFFFEKSIAVDIILCLWALTPALPSTDGMYCYNTEMLEESSPIKVYYWSELDPIEEKITRFSSYLDHLIDVHITNRSKDFTYIENGSLFTISLEKMTITDEATSVERPIIDHSAEKYILPKLTKPDRENQRIIILHDFATIAYKIIHKIYTRNTSTQIHYICLEALLSMLIYMNDSDFNEIVCPETDSTIWKHNEVIELVRHGFRYGNRYVRMVSLQIIAVLIHRRKQTFKNLCLRNGLLYELANPHSNNTAAAINDLSITIDAVINVSIETFTREMQDVVGHQYQSLFIVQHRFTPINVKKSENCLRIIASSLLGETITKFEVKFLMGSLLDYLTAVDEDEEDRATRFRMFLNVFAKLPFNPSTADFEVSEEPFAGLLKRLQDILIHVSDFDAYGKLYLRAEHYRAGLRTLNRLSSRPLNLSIFSGEEGISFPYLPVFPFTTIDFLENFILSHVAPAAEYKDGHYVNRSKRVYFYFEGMLLPPTLTIYEVIKKYRTDRGCIHEMIYRLYYKVRDLRCRDFVSAENVMDAYTLNKSKGPGAYAGNFLEGEQALRLIQILYGLNRHWSTFYEYADHKFLVSPEKFVVEKLDRQAVIAMKDPYKVLLGQLPQWIDIMDICPFIFSEETRRSAFIIRCADRHRAFRNVTGDTYIGNYSLAHVHCRRQHILEDLEMALQTTRPFSRWAASFEGEAGIGSGPVREIFTIAARELQSSTLGIWIGSENSNSGYITVEGGLYPVVKSSFPIQDVSIFKTIGQIIGKSILEKQMVDIPFALPFIKWLLQEENSLALNDLKQVTPNVYHVLKGIDKMLIKYECILDDPNLSAGDKASGIEDLTMERSTIESYHLTFVLPGHDDMELVPDGANVPVSLENARQFIEEVTHFFLKGVKRQMNAVKLGVDSIFNIDHLRAFSPEELNRLLYGDGAEEYWTMDHLRRSTFLMGFNQSCPVVHLYFHVISSLCKTKRKHFLEFLTGSPSLPVGGFKNLSPRFAIMRCDNVSPYVQTCFNRIVTPADLSYDDIKRFIDLGITEGRNFFGIC